MAESLKYTAEDVVVRYLSQFTDPGEDFENLNISAAHTNAENSLPLLVVEASNVSLFEDMPPATSIREVEIIVTIWASQNDTSRASLDAWIGKVSEHMAWNVTTFQTFANKAAEPDTRAWKPFHLYDCQHAAQPDATRGERWQDEIHFSLVCSLEDGPV